jgi:hypothetical protein
MNWDGRWENLAQKVATLADKQKQIVWLQQMEAV